MNTTLARIAHLSSTERKTLAERALKLGEEAGEVARAVLGAVAAPGSEHRPGWPGDILEEVCDVILCALSIAYRLGYPTSLVVEALERKADKWEQQQRYSSSGIADVKTDEITSPPRSTSTRT